MRADAARNRQRILDVAYEAFAADGLGVPVGEVARRAGVGPGTVYRHFPDKEALFRAIAADRLERYVGLLDELAATLPPGAALVELVRRTAVDGAADQVLSQAIAGTGLDLRVLAPDLEERFLAGLDALVRAARQEGTLRPGLGAHDVKVLLIGCQAMQAYATAVGGDASAAIDAAVGALSPAAGLR